MKSQPLAFRLPGQENALPLSSPSNEATWWSQLWELPTEEPLLCLRGLTEDCGQLPAHLAEGPVVPTLALDQESHTALLARPLQLWGLHSLEGQQSLKEVEEPIRQGLGLSNPSKDAKNTMKDDKAHGVGWCPGMH